MQQKAVRGDYEHMVIHSSIIRPAANDYIQEYLRRLHGGVWEPIHPLLEDILDETYGIMVYQEQVSQAAMALAGFSHAQGDRLRKAMTWKDPGRALQDYRDRFEAGARARGVSPEKVDEVWRMMLSFSGYSFCKPHSASYARVSFQAAYLKAHYPAQFMAAVISNQGGFYSTFAYVSEARRLGLSVLGPCVNQSRVRWTGQGHEVRTGLMAIKGLGRETRQRLLAAREERAFAGFADFLQRVRPADDEARALIHAGAFEALHPGLDPARLLWQLAQGRAKAKARGKTDSLFTAGPIDTPPLPPSQMRERLRRQYAVLGFLPGRHPMELFAGQLRGKGLIKARDLPQHAGRRVGLAGWLLTGKTVTTGKREPMQFLTFEDGTGLVEATFFPEAFRKFHMTMDWSRPYVLHGLVEENYGATTLTVDRCKSL